MRVGTRLVEGVEVNDPATGERVEGGPWRCVFVELSSERLGDWRRYIIPIADKPEAEATTAALTAVLGKVADEVAGESRSPFVLAEG